MNLIQHIAKNKSLRRLFGKQELVILKKQVLGIALTPSEKTRLSRDIRKKCQAIREIANFVRPEDLKQGSYVNGLIQDAVELARHTSLAPQIKKIVLFGSTADRTRMLNSDIDIAVEFSSITPTEAFAFRKEMAGQLPEMMDVQVYNLLPNDLKKEIDSKGKVVWKE